MKFDDYMAIFKRLQVAYTDDYTYKGLMTKNVGGEQMFTEITFVNPVEQILYINADVHSERMFPRKDSCNPNTAMAVFVTDSNYNYVGDYEWIGWSGVAS